PVAGLRAAGAGVDAQDRGTLVVRAGKKEGKLGLLEVLLQPAEFALDLGDDPGPFRFRLGLGEFQDLEVVADAAFRGKDAIDLPSDAVGLVDELLGLLPVVPEVVPGHGRFDFRQSGLLPGDVKETSAGWQPWRRWRQVSP